MNPRDDDRECPSCQGTGIGDPGLGSACPSCAGSGETREDRDSYDDDAGESPWEAA